MNPVKRAVGGSQYVFEGIKLTQKIPGIVPWLLAPIAIDIILIIVFLQWGWLTLTGLVTSALGLIFTTSSGFWYTVLYYPMLLILGLGFTVMVVYGVYLLATVIASPFNSVLAEKTLAHYGVLEKRPFEFKRWITVSVRMMIVSLIRAIIFGIIGVFLFLFSFLPGLNFLSSFAAFLILAFDSTDYCYEHMEYGLKQRFQHFKQHLPEFSGMAGVMGLTLLVPGLTLLLLPINVIGASSIYAKTQIGKSN